MKTKEMIRKEAIYALKKRKKYQIRYYSKLVNNHLTALINTIKIKNKSILFYLPMDHEADIVPSLYYFRQKCKVYVPFMENVSFKMVAYRLPLKAGRFGIREPRVTKTNIRNIEIIVVPIIAVDKVFKRVGFGKGMYDRFYEKLNKKPIVIFVQPFPIYSNTQVTEKHDIAGDYLVTYRGILQKEVRNGDRSYRRQWDKRSSRMVSYKEIPFRQIQFFSSRCKS